MTVIENPMYSRQRLARRLRKGREKAELTQQQVAESFGWSPSKVIRLESGTKPANVPDVMVLLNAYGIAGEEAEQLIELARVARQPSRYARYKDIMSPEFEAFLAYEESASVIRDFARNVVPGLLQTEEYAEEVLKSFDVPEAELDTRVALRMDRKKVLENETKFFYILDESVLRRQVGSEATMRRQYEALAMANARPNVKVMFVPFKAGLYPFFRAPYTILEFPDSREELIAYLEKPETQEILSEKMPKSNRPNPSEYLAKFYEVERSLALDLSEGDWS
ncbi:transcriptional regulator [Streptomyces minutiscleroticus]|uniref:Transcriptional regulator n=1 Tax=Streptomyces minutiscleroticus TaxID=68238 RepID=A0A918U8J1_9ACTN|nr:helix-turn-helix transcriptional regulator [Streptomyces minutiscleroticus]GGY10166.1 transcriptional regulator [Streptomyces minutiscleroticus]